MVEFELNQLIIELNAIAGKAPKRKENSANNAAVSKAEVEVEISGICG